MSKEFIAVFGVRHDKYRGILIETIKTSNGDECFFKYQDQTLDRHCIQLQNIIRTAKVVRSKKIPVDIAPFLDEYYHKTSDKMLFKGTKLMCTESKRYANEERNR